MLAVQINKASMPKHQCQSINANANVKAQCHRTCEAAALPMESSAAGPRGALAPSLEFAAVLLLLLLLLSVADAVLEETGAEAVEETEAEAVEETEAEAVLLNAAAVLLLLDCGAGGQVPLIK